MRFRVEQIRAVRGTGMVYADVAFLDGEGAVVHRNDFLMQVPASRRFYTGEVGPGGEVLDPDAFVEVASDARSVIVENIRRYAARLDLHTARVDARDGRIRTDASDPAGIVARTDVQELVDAVLDSETGEVVP